MKLHSSTSNTFGNIGNQLTYRNNILENEIELVYLKNNFDITHTILDISIESQLDIVIALVPDAIDTSLVNWENGVPLEYDRKLRVTKPLASNATLKLCIKYIDSYFVPVRLNDLSLKVTWI